jgi:hypothetical protein
MAAGSAAAYAFGCGIRGLAGLAKESETDRVRRRRFSGRMYMMDVFCSRALKKWKVG